MKISIEDLDVTHVSIARHAEDPSLLYLSLTIEDNVVVRGVKVPATKLAAMRERLHWWPWPPIDDYLR